MRDRHLISCIAFIYVNSRKEVLNLQEIYDEMRRHFKDMEKFYKDMDAAIQGIIYQIVPFLPFYSCYPV